MADALTSITGLSSGIDSKALVEQMMKLERRPADRLQATVDANSGRTAALGQFQTALQALQTATTALTDGSAFDAYSVTSAGVASSGRALLSATAAAGAVPGAYQVKVLNLATAHKLSASVGQTSATAALGAVGTFELRRPDDTVLGAITLDGTESLSTIRDRINAFTGTSKVQAGIVSANADGTDQRLVVSSQQTGAAGRFKFVTTSVPDVPVDTDGDGVDDSTAPGPDPLAQLGLAAPKELTGKDATLDIDGVVVTRATNTVTDAIQGVTLALSADDQNAVSTVTVDRYKATPRDAVKGFVDAYNKVRTFITDQSKAGAPLADEAMLRSARGSLAGVVLAKGVGLPNDYATFASVGVSLNKDGTLAFDATRFDAAYAGHYDQLKTTLANRVKAVSDFADSVAAPMVGAIDQREMALTDLNLRLTDRIAAIDARLDKKRTALLAQFAKFEATLGGITSLGNSLSAQLKGLNSSSND